MARNMSARARPEKRSRRTRWKAFSQYCGEQHLQRYLAEFDFRQNNRAKLGVTDDMRAVKALEGIRGKRLNYRRTDEA